MVVCVALISIMGHLLASPMVVRWCTALGKPRKCEYLSVRSDSLGPSKVPRRFPELCGAGNGLGLLGLVVFAL